MKAIPSGFRSSTLGKWYQKGNINTQGAVVFSGLDHSGFEFETSPGFLTPTQSDDG